MREIKFRVWAKKLKQVIYMSDARKTPYCLRLDLEGHLYDTAYDRDDEDENVNDCFELMQFTGLKDKKGNEIYEGDLIEAWFPGMPHNMRAKQVITFMNGFFGCGSYPLYMIDRYSILVIGNQFENKELYNEIMHY